MGRLKMSDECSAAARHASLTVKRGDALVLPAPIWSGAMR
jgi:hypothetical protein